MAELLNSFLLVYAGLFPIVGPVGNAPIFLALTRFRSDAERERLARQVSVNGFMLLLGSLFLGSHVLQFFGITLPVLRVAGGLVVTAFAWKLLHSGEDPDTPGPTPEGAAEAFYPLTMPLTVGPGSISVAIAIGSQRPAAPADLASLLPSAAGAVLGILAIAASVYVSYRFASRIIAFLGATGTQIVMRLSAFILLCIGIQIMWNGYKALMAAG